MAYVSVLTDSRCDSLDGLVYFGLGGMRVHDALPSRSQAGAQTVSQPPAPKLVVPQPVIKANKSTSCRFHQLSASALCLVLKGLFSVSQK